MVKIIKKKIENKINFFIKKLHTSNFDKIKLEFNKLPNDKYLKNKDWIFRKRSFAKGQIKNGKIKWSKSTIFFQSKKINKYAGGIVRKFCKMSLNLKKFSNNLIEKNLINNKIITNDFKFGVHAIRIVCNKKFNGFPVPEGFHKDGVDFVMIIPINQKNCSGGTSYLKENKINKIVLKNKILKGNFLFFNDKKFMHYATPIKLKKGILGFRDIFVLTFSY